MAQNPYEPVERPQQRPETEDVQNIGDTDELEEDVDPDSAESENDRDDTLTD